MKIDIEKIDEIAQKIVDELHPELYVSLDDSYNVAEEKDVKRIPMENRITRVLTSKLDKHIKY